MHSKPPRISDGLRTKFQAIATETAELVPPSAYANYVIIDPTTADPERILPGAAIYVGQTSELRSRIRSHLRQAIRPAPEHAQLYHYMARLISRGAWPVFRVLETHTNRVDCMLAETVWAQRLLRSGARLFNTWPEQSRLLTASSLRRRVRAGCMRMFQFAGFTSVAISRRASITFTEAWGSRLLVPGQVS